MKKGFLDRVEDNAAVRTWVEMTQREKDKHLFRALAQFWNQAYSCFTFGKVDLMPTIDEYMALLRCSKILVDKVYSKAVNAPTFSKRLINITGMTHPDARKKVDVFALSIYGLVVFPKTLGHVDETVTDLFDRLEKRVTPVPVILAETFRSLNACWRAGEGRFIGCAQLLLAWFHSHFWKVDKVSYRVFSESYSPLKEIVATPRRDDVSEEKWIVIFQNLQEEDIEWRAPWLLPDEILYWCGDFDWVPLIGIWGAIGYAPLLVLKQYRSRQFVPATQGLAECEFWYRGDVDGGALRVVPTELEIIKQDFERRSAELEKIIEQMEEEKVNLRLDVDVQKLEADKLRKGKNKAEEELDSLKANYKKLRLSMRTAGHGKTLEQWCEEIREETNRSDRWERKFQEVQAQNEALEKRLSESQKEKGELKDRVVELEGSLR
ncbi:hypothetical protein Gotri_025295 [Gossypium trilobum]|uniref:DUF7745 domain-containing protein n=3 Tax=Gossypium trilobum TaxID=34281 RepID=A0A7J9FHM8_9ROSI|nr:hypothetical protein [Gossypium trilobum]